MSLFPYANHDEKFLVIGFGEVSIDPHFPDRYAVRCELMPLIGSNEQPFSVAVTFSEWPLYHINALIGRRRARLVNKLKKTRFEKHYFSGRMFHYTEQVHEEVRLKDPENTLVSSFVKQRSLYMDENGYEVVAIDAIEIARFYIGLCNLLIGELSISYSDDSDPLDNIVNREKSGWVDDEKTIFAIYPRRAYCGMESSLQIALLLADEEIYTFIWSTLLYIKMDLMKRNVTGFFLPFTGDGMKFSALTETIFSQVVNGQQHKFQKVVQIISDYREPPFKELIINYPFSGRSSAESPPGDSEINDPDTDPDEGNPYFDPNGPVSGRWRPSNKSTRIKIGAKQLAKALPSWERVTVSSAYSGDTPKTKHRPKTRKEPPTAPFSSPLPGVGESRGLGIGPAAAANYADMVRPKIEITPLNLMMQYPEAFLGECQVEYGSLHFLSRSFLKAGEEIANFLDLDLMSSGNAEGDYVRAFQLPEDWGRFSRKSRNGFPRYLLALPVEIEGRIVWVLEINRRNDSEKFSMGIATAEDARSDPIQFLSHFMFAITQRKSIPRGDEPRGTWPTSSYLDVRIDNLHHTRSRYHHGNLGMTILQRCRWLASPSEL
jgi:hypothetical protein